MARTKKKEETIEMENIGEEKKNSIGDKVKKLMHINHPDMTKEEIQQEYAEKMTLESVPAHLQQELFDVVNANWKQKLNPDMLFMGEPADAGWMKFLPFVQIVASVITMIVVLTHK